MGLFSYYLLVVHFLVYPLYSELFKIGNGHQRQLNFNEYFILCRQCIPSLDTSSTNDQFLRFFFLSDCKLLKPVDNLERPSTEWNIDHKSQPAIETNAFFKNPGVSNSDQKLDILLMKPNSYLHSSCIVKQYILAGMYSKCLVFTCGCRNGNSNVILESCMCVCSSPENGKSDNGGKLDDFFYSKHLPLSGINKCPEGKVLLRNRCVPIISKQLDHSVGLARVPILTIKSCPPNKILYYNICIPSKFVSKPRSRPGKCNGGQVNTNGDCILNFMGDRVTKSFLGETMDDAHRNNQFMINTVRFDDDFECGPGKIYKGGRCMPEFNVEDTLTPFKLSSTMNNFKNSNQNNNELMINQESFINDKFECGKVYNNGLCIPAFNVEDNIDQPSRNVPETGTFNVQNDELMINTVPFADEFECGPGKYYKRGRCMPDFSVEDFIATTSINVPIIQKSNQINDELMINTVSYTDEFECGLGKYYRRGRCMPDFSIEDFIAPSSLDLPINDKSNQISDDLMINTVPFTDDEFECGLGKYYRRGRCMPDFSIEDFIAPSSLDLPIIDKSKQNNEDRVINKIPFEDDELECGPGMVYRRDRCIPIFNVDSKTSHPFLNPQITTMITTIPFTNVTRCGAGKVYRNNRCMPTNVLAYIMDTPSPNSLQFDNSNKNADIMINKELYTVGFNNHDLIVPHNVDCDEGKIYLNSRCVPKFNTKRSILDQLGNKETMSKFKNNKVNSLINTIPIEGNCGSGEYDQNGQCISGINADGSKKKLFGNIFRSKIVFCPPGKKLIHNKCISSIIDQIEDSNNKYILDCIKNNFFTNEQCFSKKLNEIKVPVDTYEICSLDKILQGKDCFREFITNTFNKKDKVSSSSRWTNIENNMLRFPIKTLPISNTIKCDQDKYLVGERCMPLIPTLSFIIPYNKQPVCPEDKVLIHDRCMPKLFINIFSSQRNKQKPICHGNQMNKGDCKMFDNRVTGQIRTVKEVNYSTVYGCQFNQKYIDGRCVPKTMKNTRLMKPTFMTVKECSLDKILHENSCVYPYVCCSSSNEIILNRISEKCIGQILDSELCVTYQILFNLKPIDKKEFSMVPNIPTPARCPIGKIYSSGRCKSSG